MDVPSRERFVHIPPNRKFGKSSTHKCENDMDSFLFEGDIVLLCSWYQFTCQCGFACVNLSTPFRTSKNRRNFACRFSDGCFAGMFEGSFPETNIAPENGWLEYKFPFGMAYFQGLWLLVSGRVLYPFFWGESNLMQVYGRF